MTTTPINPLVGLHWEISSELMTWERWDQEAEPVCMPVTNCGPDAIVNTATPIRQKRIPDMSKQFQTGSVKLVGNVWKGRYWQDVPGEEKRKHPQVDLGTRQEMTKRKAQRKMEDIIDKLGINNSNFVERLEVPPKTFNDVADAWIEKRLPQLALSTQDSAP